MAIRDSGAALRHVIAFFFMLTASSPIGYFSPRLIVATQDVTLSREPSGQKERIRRSTSARLFLGDITVYDLSANGQKIRGKTAGVDRRLEPGNSVYVRLPAEKLKIFSK